MRRAGCVQRLGEGGRAAVVLYKQRPARQAREYAPSWDLSPASGVPLRASSGSGGGGGGGGGVVVAAAAATATSRATCQEQRASTVTTSALRAAELARGMTHAKDRSSADKGAQVLGTGLTSISRCSRRVR